MSLRGAALALACALAVPALARADHATLRGDARVYVVTERDTLSRIAMRLHVARATLAALNHLQPPYRLALGRRLRVPERTGSDGREAAPPTHAATSSTRPSARGHQPDSEAPQRRSGIVTLVRLRDHGEVTTNFGASDASFSTRMTRFFRFRDGSRHLMHPRLLRAIAALSDRFDGAPIAVLSGFRPQPRGVSERTRHSQGYAVDVRIAGVEIDELHRFCKSLENMGCGMYPRAGFEHIDVRLHAAEWIDGAAPHSDRAARHVSGSDETVDEVTGDAAPTRAAVSAGAR